MSQIRFKPFYKQRKALEKLRDNETTEVLYGWGTRGWKSYLGNAWIIMNCFSMPGSAWLIGRKELKRLKATTLLTFFEVARDFWLKKDIHFKYLSQDWQILFAKGKDKKGNIIFEGWSIIFLVDLKYMPSDPKYDRLGSYGLTGAFIDEAQEIDPKVPNVLKGRFSVLKDKKWRWQTKPKALYTCNPWKGWIYNEFWKPFKEWTLPKRKVFIQSLVTDNPHIEQDYIDTLRTSDKITQERLLKGNFDYDDMLGKLYDYDSLCDMFTNPKTNGQKYIVWDIAWLWDDKTIITVWDWWEVIDYIVLEENLIDEVLDNKFRNLCQKHGVPMRNVIVDQIGIGQGVVWHLGCKGFISWAKIIQPAGSKKDDTQKFNYMNLRSQCFFFLTKIINQSKINLTKLVWFKTEILEELDTICEVNIDKDDQKRQVIKKEDIKKLITKSPDWADVIMMRCYFELDKSGSLDDVKKINELYQKDSKEILINMQF